MPYDASKKSKLPTHVQKLSKAKREQWVAIWNSTYAQCTEDGGGKETCEAKAFTIANGAVKKEQSMSKWQKIVDGIRNVLQLAESELPEAQPADTVSEPLHRRTIASAQIMNQVRDYVDQRNKNAYRVDPNTGGTYIDWDLYFNVLDLYYDDDGSLFLLGQQKGKLYRVPITVTEDVVEFGEMLELSLTAERSLDSIVVTRDSKTGVRRWFMIASSAVLNRVNEIDSTKLFDNFVRRAKESSQYPVLTFYHKKDFLSLGQADWLAREGYLYLAAGNFADTPDGQRCADALESSDKRWGASIGYVPLADPEFFEIIRGVEIPVFTDGINQEISIVLEHDAADRFTRASTEEVNRAMRKNEYDALVEMFGEARAKELAATIDGTNRAIEESELIRRGGDAVANVTAPVTPAVAAATETVVTETAVVAEPTNVELAATEAQTADRELELDEDTLAALADALTQHPTLLQLQTSLLQLTETVAALTPQLETLQTETRALADQTEERLAQLERDEGLKQAEWMNDLPALARTRITFRPREQRREVSAQELAQENMGTVANATLANLKTRKPG